MDALADADSRAVSEAKQAKWGALWAGAVTIGAIAWVLSGLPQTRAPDVLESTPHGAPPPPSTAPIEPVKPVTLKEPITVTTPVATSDVAPAKPALLAQETAVRRPTPPRVAQTARARTPAPRINEDARIRTQVAERLTANRTIWGRIGIDSRGSVVYLTGYTMTMEQARRAEREARSVRGVRAVRNEIRPRVGGAY